MSTIQNTPQSSSAMIPVNQPSVSPARQVGETQPSAAPNLRAAPPPATPTGIPSARVEQDIEQAFRTSETTQSGSDIQNRFQAVQGILPQLGGGGNVNTAPLTHGGGIDDSGLGLNNSRHHALRSASGPISPDAWQHPEQIVGRLTQTPADGSHGNSSIRCGPSSLLGAALMQGPLPAARFLDSVANSDTGGRLTRDQAQDLRNTAQGLRTGHVSFEQLSQAQNLLYRAGNTRGNLDGFINQTIGNMPNGEDRTRLQSLRTQLQNGAWTSTQAREAETIMQRATGQAVAINLVDDPQHPGDASRQYYTLGVQGGQARRERSGFDDSEMEGLARTGGAIPRVIRPTSSDTLQSLYAQISPGESLSVRVAADSGGVTNQNNNSDHFISLGRTPNGTPFLYNPYPTQGDHTLFTGAAQNPQPTSFTDQLARYNDRLLLDSDNDMPNATVSRFNP